MTPRNPAHIGPDGKGFFGTVTVGRRGQVALPAQARRQLGLEPGDQLVVLTDPAQGLALIPLRLLLERAPNDPLAMLVRSTLGGSAPTGPPPGEPGAGPQGAPPSAPPAAPGAPGAPPAAGPATAYAPPAPPATSAPTHQEQS
ncbi:AbrB/MazE/SpoVT family DNA-binding domain-containing protein [Actinomyces dentalis]|uniref:AbrB/MazE/SpoVT family DNA-binding domain-containing protein n=1 Tax=Actinomyces dentalis TaxID=272548 RepID=UPI0028E97EAD|nr:AbrB/MazE/SpoVT family DNA-binding domain-containing protein [Actinomyces dentalis]